MNDNNNNNGNFLILPTFPISGCLPTYIELYILTIMCFILQAVLALHQKVKEKSQGMTKSQNDSCDHPNNTVIVSERKTAIARRRS